MTTFTDKQQKKHRETFIEQCRQKAWGAACHADWLGSQLDKLIEDYAKFKKDDELLEAEIKTLEIAVDAHTKDNRDKRKSLQERRYILTKQMEAASASMQQGQRGLNELHQSAEANLQIAAHAEKWEWKEVVAEARERAQEDGK